MADAEDLKSSGDFSSCGFDSHPGHQLARRPSISDRSTSSYSLPDRCTNEVAAPGERTILLVCCWATKLWQARDDDVPNETPLGWTVSGKRRNPLMGVYRSDKDLEAAQGTGSGAAIHRSDEPTRLSLGMLRPRRARFRFARQDHCSFTASIRLNFRMGRKPLGTAASARPG